MGLKVADFTDKPFHYYVEKFQRRLFRRLLEYQVLTLNLADNMEAVTPETLELLALPPELVKGIEVKDHIEKACLTGLKAEFELFFTIYTALVVDHLLKRVEETGGVPAGHEGLVDALGNPKKFYDAFMKAGLRDARRIYVEQALPKHGLGNLEQLLTKCGWDISTELADQTGEVLGGQFSGVITRPWSQVQTAFQVRHSIEHTFSKVGQGFLHHAKHVFRDTTWRRWWAAPPEQPGIATKAGLSGRPRLGDRVFIDEVDIRGTASCMSWVSRYLLVHWEKTTTADTDAD